MKIGYIQGYTISHHRLKESLNILCEKTNSELVVSSIFKDINDKLDLYAQCDLVIDENRVYQRQGNQKIVYWYTGAGDMSTACRSMRQSCKNLDYVICPKHRADMSTCTKYVSYGNPISLYFERFYDEVVNHPKDAIVVPEENCFSMPTILKIAEEISEKEGLEVLYKTRDNAEDIETVFDYFKRAKYIITGFSSMLFEGLFFGIEGFMVGGLNPANVTNDNKLFYRELISAYPELVIRNYNDFVKAKDTANYSRIHSEHYNEKFIENFMNLVRG